MTALQDWLTLRPVDHGLREMVCRPLRAALNSPALGTPAPASGHPGRPAATRGFTLQRPGIERC